MDEDFALPEQSGWKAALAGAQMMAFLQILGIVLAISGQAILVKTNSDMPNELVRQGSASSLLIAGAILFGLGTRRSRSDLARLEFPADGADRPARIRYEPWAQNLLAAAICLALVGIALFWIRGESTAVVAIWICSIVGLLAAQFSRASLRWPRINHQEQLYLLGLAVVLLIGLIMRTYRLTLLPLNVDGDFAEVGSEARALFAGERHIFAYGWAGVPMLGYMPPWLTMHFFGTGLAGLNASGVLEGLLIVLGVYLLGRDLFHARVGLIAAAIMTVSYAHLAASRQSSYIDPAFFLLYSVYFLLLGLREAHGWAIVSSGIMAALCLEMYHSGKIVILITGFILLYLALFRRHSLWARRGRLVLWGLSILITLGPMLLVILQDPQDYTSRTQDVFIFSQENIRHMEGIFHTGSLSGVLLQQARHSLFLFNYYTGTDTQFGMQRPFLDAVTATLFTLGIGFALFHWRKLGSALLLAWTTLGVVFGSLLTINPPFWPRLIVLLAPAILLAGIALDRIFETLDRSIRGSRQHLAWVAPTLVMVMLVWLGYSNWNTYVEVKGAYATPRTRIARYLAEQPASFQAYLLSNDFDFTDREFRFIAPRRFVANLTTEQLEGNIEAIDTPALLILTHEQEQALAWLRQRYPEAPVDTEPGNSPGDIAFYAFHIP